MKLASLRVRDLRPALLRPFGLALLTLGATSLAHAQYGTMPAYGGSSGVMPAPTYGTPGYNAPGYGNSATTAALPNYGTTANTMVQNQMSPDVSQGSIAQTLNNAERTQNAQSLLMLYGQAVTSPELARAAITQLLSNYWSLRNSAKTAEQATQAVAEAELRFQVFQAAQNQVLVQQNQQILQQNARIIALLEAQSRARQGTTR